MKPYLYLILILIFASVAFADPDDPCLCENTVINGYYGVINSTCVSSCPTADDCCEQGTVPYSESNIPINSNSNIMLTIGIIMVSFLYFRGKRNLDKKNNI